MYLDVACGTGSLIKELTRIIPGIRAFGIDRSAQMVAVAKSKGVDADCADMSELPGSNLYDLITCTFDSLNYLPDTESLSATFRSIATHLKHQGLFVFDMITPYQVNERAPTFAAKYSRLDGADIVWLNDHQPDIWLTTIIIYRREGELYRRFAERHVSRAFSRETIEEQLETANLEVVHLYGDLDLSAPHTRSKRWYYVVRKSL